MRSVRICASSYTQGPGAGSAGLQIEARGISEDDSSDRSATHSVWSERQSRAVLD